MIDLAFGLYMAEAEGYDLTTGEKKRYTNNVQDMIERTAASCMRNTGYMFTSHRGWQDLTKEEQDTFVENVNFLYSIKDDYYLSLQDVMNILTRNLEV